MDRFAADETLVLRRLQPGDIARFSAYRSDPDVSQFQSWEQMNHDQTLGFLVHMSRIKTAFTAGTWTQVAVALADTNELIGDMGLFLAQDSGFAELGVSLARSFQGKGLGTRVMRMAMELTFRSTTCDKIICGADSRNAASLAMIRKLGFKYTHSETTDGITDEMFEMHREAFKPQ